MSARWKGYGGVTLVSREPAFEAESGVEVEDRFYAGSQSAIFGLGVTLKAQGISFRINKIDGPVYGLSARIPINEPTQEVLDRYEITTEAQEKSIFELPGVMAEIAAFDDIAAEGSTTYRERAELAVGKAPGASVITSPLFLSVVRHLKSGVTGYQIDFVCLRRFRQVDLSYAYAGGQITLDTGFYIYTTNQLQLPAGVAFNLPATPAAPSSDYQWGWRKRGQRVEIVGNYAEQTVELVFAPWSLLAYTTSGGNLAW